MGKVVWALSTLAQAILIVLLFPLAILLVALPAVLFIRLMLEIARRL